MSESDHQITVVDWYKLTYPAFAGCIMAFVNERTKMKNTPKYVWANYLKKLARTGMKKGVSDLFIAVPRGTYHGLFIEMKDVGKTYSSVTKDQREHIGLMRLMGYRAEWAPGADKAMEIIAEYMGEN